MFTAKFTDAEPVAEKFNVTFKNGVMKATYNDGDDTFTIIVDGSEYTFWTGSYFEITIGDTDYELNEVKNYAKTSWSTEDGKIQLIFTADGAAVNAVVKFDDGTGMKDGTITSFDVDEGELRISVGKKEFVLYYSRWGEYWEVQIGDDDFELNEEQSVNIIRLSKYKSKMRIAS